MASETHCGKGEGKGKGKNKRQGESGPGPDGEPELSERSSKKAGRGSASSPRYPCPWFMHNPHEYYACGTHRFQKIYHVTQHLERAHLPKTDPKKVTLDCPRCGTEFDAESDRDTHVRDECCQLMPIKRKYILTERWVEIQAVTTDRSKKRDEKWNSINMILFGEPASQLLPQYSEPAEYLLHHFLQHCSHSNDNSVSDIQPSVDVIRQVISSYLAGEPIPFELQFAITRPLPSSSNAPETSAQDWVPSIPEGASAASSQRCPTPVSATQECQGSDINNRNQFEDFPQNFDNIDTEGSISDFDFEAYYNSSA